MLGDLFLMNACIRFPKIMKGFNLNSPSGYESILLSGTLKGFNNNHIEPLSGFLICRTLLSRIAFGAIYI